MVHAGEGDRPRRSGGRLLTTNLVQDSNSPLADVQNGPAPRTDARHKFTISAILQAPWGITVSPVFRYRSALPMHAGDNGQPEHRVGQIGFRFVF